jgi:3-deoxy-7-phosphoheptulonate synthase
VAIGVLRNKGAVDASHFLGLPGVKEVIPVTRPYKLVSREFQPEDTVVRIGDVSIGNEHLTLIAGPCAVESETQCLKTAQMVKQVGAHLFRGGAFKPRTSPYSFQGLGEEGLKILDKVRETTGMPVITEALDTETFGLVEDYTDVIQIGARNMQNFSLLRRAGRSKKPVLVKRGLSATIEEWLMAAEYIMEGGNTQVILCERGVRTFAHHSRNTLDLSAVAVVCKESHLPVIVDPSHAAGRRDQVIPLSRAGIAVGAHGLMVEVHHNPEEALSDGAQSLYPEQFETLCQEIQAIFDVFHPS